MRPPHLEDGRIEKEDEICLIFTSNELSYAGIDPNQMRFKRAGCFDVGVQCRGRGHIAPELSVEDRNKLNE